jgi:hypothetical protein
MVCYISLSICVLTITNPVGCFYYGVHFPAPTYIVPSQHGHNVTVTSISSFLLSSIPSIHYLLTCDFTLIGKYIKRDISTGVELEDREGSMQKSNSVIPNEWTSRSSNNNASANVNPVKDGARSGNHKAGSSLYWFTGVPEHMKIFKPVSKRQQEQQLKQCKSLQISIRLKLEYRYINFSRNVNAV